MRKKVFERFHGKVTRWFTFNEPIVVQTRVYLDALRWPYEQNTSTGCSGTTIRCWRRRKW